MPDATNTIGGDPVVLPGGNLGIGTAAQSGAVVIADGSGHQVGLIAGTGMAADLQLELPSAYSDALLGTPLLLTDAGQLKTLPDPGGDRILFWDDSADGAAYLSIGSGLAISGTTLSATPSGITIGDHITASHAYRYLRTDATGNLAENAALTVGRVPYATTNGLLTDSASLTYDGSTFSISSPVGVQGLDVRNAGAGSATAVFVWSTATTGSANIGIRVDHSSSGGLGTGVEVNMRATSGVNSGIIVENLSSSAGSMGIFAYAHGVSGAIYGVYGITSSSDNQAYGGYFDKCLLETYLDLTTQASDPVMPASGFGRLYSKTDKRPYLKDDGGTIHHLARHAQVYYCSQGNDQLAAGDCNVGYKINSYTGGLVAYSTTPPAVTITDNTSTAASAAVMFGNYLSASYTRWSWDPTVAAFPPTQGKQVQVSVGAPLHRPLADASGHESGVKDVRASLVSNTWASVSTAELNISSFDEACFFVLDFAGRPGNDPITTVDVAYFVLEQWAA
jgi:hypothetical protein